jgi:hypothetical protein
MILCACGNAAQTPSGDAGTPETGVSCSAAVKGLEIATVSGFNLLDPLGYAPFASEGCTLVFVARDGSLALRDLSTSSGTVTLAPASEKPRRPAIANGTIVWESNGSIRFRTRYGAVQTIPTVGFDHAGEPRITNDAIVFVGWLAPGDASDSDVFVFSLTDETTTVIGSGPGQQRFPDIDETRVAYADFGEGGPSGAFDINQFTPADIVVVDRASKAKTKRALPGKQGFPMLIKDGGVSYLDWGWIHPEPKFSEYRLKVGAVTSDPANDADVPMGSVKSSVPYQRPSVRGNAFEWLQNGELWRRDIDLARPPSRVAYDQSIYGTVAADGMSIVAIVGMSGATLDAIPR